MMNTVAVLNDVSVQFRKQTVSDLTLKNNIYRLLTRQRLPIFTALDNITLQIHENETIGIIGNNGAGKTTLLRTLAGIIIPTIGQVEVFKRVVPLLELGIGFHPELSGRENCFLAGALLGFTPSQIQERIDRIIDFSGVAAFIDAPVKNYSSGMYARLAFSLATEVDPQLLLLDEILGVGDQEFQRKCVVRIQNLIRKGVTAVIVSHNVDFLVTHCNRLIWLDRGRLKEDGPPEDVARSYFETV